VRPVRARRALAALTRLSLSCFLSATLYNFPSDPPIWANIDERGNGMPKGDAVLQLPWSFCPLPANGPLAGFGGERDELHIPARVTIDPEWPIPGVALVTSASPCIPRLSSLETPTWPSPVRMVRLAEFGPGGMPRRRGRHEILVSLNHDTDGAFQEDRLHRRAATAP